MNLYTQLPSNSSQDENIKISRINFWAFAHFLFDFYKLLLLGASVGVTLGFLVWFYLNTYKAEIILPNQWGDIESIRTAESNWAELAHQISNESSLASEDKSFYTTLSSINWWNKSVKINYAITRLDIKDLVGSTEIKGGNILNLQVTWIGKDANSVKDNIVKVVDFINYSTPYIMSKDLLEKYNSAIFISEVETKKKLHEAQFELVIAERRLVNLEEMQKRFPSGSFSVNLADFKEWNTKFLPISSQIIAAKSDIFAFQEAIKQTQVRFDQDKTINEFINAANTLISKEKNSKNLVDELLVVEEQFRVKVPKDDLIKMIALDKIRLDLVNIKAKSNLHINKQFFPTIERTSTLMAAVVKGFFGGFFMALLICIYIVFWPVFKARLWSEN